MLRIRLPYLQALEDGRLDDLPGTAYVVGFLRSYAAILGLDPEEMVKRLRAETEPARATDLAFPAPLPERGVPTMAMVLLGVVLAVGAYGGWYQVSGSGARFAEPILPVPARLAPLAAGAVEEPVQSPHVASILPRPATSPAIKLPVDPMSAYVLPNVPPSQAAAMSMPSLAPISPAPVTPLDQAAPAAPLLEHSTPAPLPDHIVVRARADSWIQVRDKQGSVLFNRVLRSGESWTVPPDKAQLLLTTGNAGGTDLVVDGVAVPALGAVGAVRHDLPLDADQLKQGAGVPVRQRQG